MGSTADYNGTAHFRSRLRYPSLSTYFSNKNAFKGSMMKILMNDTVIFQQTGTTIMQYKF